MDTWIYLSQGFAVAMTPENLVIALIGCFVGMIVGLLPGLGPINGVAILLPLAFALHLPVQMHACSCVLVFLCSCDVHRLSGSSSPGVDACQGLVSKTGEGEVRRRNPGCPG